MLLARRIDVGDSLPRVKVTAINEPSAVEGKVTVFVYPENVCYDLTFEDIPQVCLLVSCVLVCQ